MFQVLLFMSVCSLNPSSIPATWRALSSSLPTGGHAWHHKWLPVSRHLWLSVLQHQAKEFTDRMPMLISPIILATILTATSSASRTRTFRLQYTILMSELKKPLGMLSEVSSGSLTPTAGLPD